MSIRIRVVDGITVAICAARSVPKFDDVYLDDAAHHALSIKFAADFESMGFIAPGHDDPAHATIRDREESDNVNREWWDLIYAEDADMPNVAELNKRLDEIDKAIGAVVPMVAQGAALIRLVGTLVRGKMSPDQQKTFDQSIAAYDAQLTTMQTSIDRLRAASSQTAPTGSAAVQSTASSQDGHSDG